MRVTIRNGLCTARQSGLRRLVPFWGWRKKQISLDSLLKRLINNESLRESSQLLPPNVRLMRQASGLGGKKFFEVVIEEKPQMRNTLWYSSDDPYRVKKVNLSFPYLVFVINLQSDKSQDCNCAKCVLFNMNKWHLDCLQVFYRTRPLTSLEDKLLRSNLPNVYPSGNVCLGGATVSGNDLVTTCELAVKAFWETIFQAGEGWENQELASARDRRLRSYSSWAENSALNPGFVMDVNWPEYRRPLANIIDIFWQGPLNLDMVGLAAHLPEIRSKL